MDDARSAIEAVFREQSGRIIASLIRLCGSFDRAEEALQEALTSAVATWPGSGIPDNPGAWITTAAHRRLIDAGRRERTRREKSQALGTEFETFTAPVAETTKMDYPDDRLRLIFTCCHPAINLEARVALTLRTLGGLSTTEIARAFLLPESTLAQRLVRAKHKIQEARIPYQVPPPERLPERLVSVQAVLYLIFNEGYASTSGTAWLRDDLCREAIRLGRMLCELAPLNAENLGLLALMLLQDCRRMARVADGRLVTLEHQDRSLWNQGAIGEGVRLLEKAIAQGRPGPYQIQAAIASLHAQAPTYAETDWSEIAALYGRLVELNPSPVVALNHAVAVAMTGSVAEALERLDALGTLDHYYLFHAARADLLRRLDRKDEAVAAYRAAAQLTGNPVELKFLESRLCEMGAC